ncbi:MAG TPA: flagellar hook protein FlgE [Candidatus Saccharimonadales bacterium]|nr:flagellar hook protein FlgE [Candidatus Saccharimonadales bacterium]
MLQSMFSGITGLQANQTEMDVIGNNIANINTVGFKAGRARFAEQFAQLLQAASPGTGGLGGTNPMQVGMGTEVGSIENYFTQGTLQDTGLGTDLAIQGDGFFILGGGQGLQYSRAGAFSFDGQGRLVDPGTGLVVQGYMADSTGAIAAGTALGDLRIPLDTTAPARATTSLVLHGNLNSDPTDTNPVTSTFSVYDSLGQKHTLTLTFAKTMDTSGTTPVPKPNEWDVTVTSSDGTVDTTDDGKCHLVFKSDGTLDLGTTGGSTFDALKITGLGGAADLSIDFNPSAAGAVNAFSGLTQTAGDSTAFAFSQDGYSSGTLTRTSVDSQGHVVGAFSNGITRNLGQVALARFANDAGLTKSGQNGWEESLNSGQAVVGQAGIGSFGTISAGALEGSNVDLAQEFTDLIVAQRGFQANARVITTGDEMLTEVVNIKR